MDKENAPKSNDTAVVESNPKTLTTVGERGLVFHTIDDMKEFSMYLVDSGLVPKGMEKPQAVLVALQMGFELGLSPMQSIQNIAVINGRPSIWGDALPGLVRASGLMESYQEEEIGTYPNEDYGFRITAKRKGADTALAGVFTMADAKKAALLTKPGPWQQYPKRMLKNRARSFCLRDNFPDVTKGLYTAEEQRDIHDAEVVGVETVSRVDALEAELTKQADSTAVDKGTGEVTGYATIEDAPKKDAETPAGSSEHAQESTQTEKATTDKGEGKKGGITDAEVDKASKDFKLK